MKKFLICTGLLLGGYCFVHAQNPPQVEHGRAIGFTTVITDNTRTTKIKCDTFFQDETCYETSTQKLNNGIQKLTLSIHATRTYGEDYNFTGTLLNFIKERSGDGKITESTFVLQENKI